MLSLNIELNSKEITLIVCQNIIKMLVRRKLLDNYEDAYNKISDDINNKPIIDFKLNNNVLTNIYFCNAKVTSITQKSPLDEFLSSNLDVHKIVVIKDLTKKVAKQINEEYKNSEFFFEHEMLEDIPMKYFIPKHQLLNKEEKEELLNKFSLEELSMIYSTDPMSRYYDAKINDVFRIIRPSITSGKSISYRRVIKGSWEYLST